MSATYEIAVAQYKGAAYPVGVIGANHKRGRVRVNRHSAKYRAKPTRPALAKTLRRVVEVLDIWLDQAVQANESIRELGRAIPAVVPVGKHMRRR